MPGDEDGDGVLRRVAERQRAARLDDENDRAAGLDERLEHLLLHARQPEIGARGAFAGDVAILGHGENDEIGAPRGGERVVLVAEGVTAFVGKALGIAKLLAGPHPLLEGGEQRFGLRLLIARRAVPGVVVGRHGCGADERDGARVGADRQRAGVVLQEDEAFARDLARGLAHARLVDLGQRRLAGLLEQAEAEFHAQDAAHGLVDGGRRHPARGQLGLEMLVVGLAFHVEIDAGEHRLACRLGKIGRDAVVDELADGGKVGHDDAAEADLALEEIGDRAPCWRSPERR